MMRLALLAALVSAAAGFSSFTPRNICATNNGSTLSMKIYDWKRRTADESALHEEEFTLGNLRPSPGARKRKNRKGRGIAAGQGARVEADSLKTLTAGTSVDSVTPRSIQTFFTGQVVAAAGGAISVDASETDKVTLRADFAA